MLGFIRAAQPAQQRWQKLRYRGAERAGFKTVEVLWAQCTPDES
jgi:hypothetical protein